MAALKDDESSCLIGNLINENGKKIIQLRDELIKEIEMSKIFKKYSELLEDLKKEKEIKHILQNKNEILSDELQNYKKQMKNFEDLKVEKNQLEKQLKEKSEILENILITLTKPKDGNEQNSGYTSEICKENDISFNQSENEIENKKSESKKENADEHKEPFSTVALEDHQEQKIEKRLQVNKRKRDLKEDNKIQKPRKRNSTKKEDFNNPIYSIPLKNGWKREIVYRANQTSQVADIYYHPPKGNRKLNSKCFIKDYQNNESDISIENFIFVQKPLGLEGEIIRHSLGRSGVEGSEKIEAKQSINDIPTVE